MNQQEYEMNYQALIEHSSDAIIVHDPEGKILYANPAALTLIGDRSLEEAMKKSVYEHLPPGFSDRASQDIQKILEGGTLPALVATVLLANGDYIEVEVRANLVNFGGRSAIQIHMRELFDRAKLIESLKQQAEDLRRSNEDLENLSHIAAHDLQEPVRTVITFIQRLEMEKKETLDAEARGYIRTIEKAGLRMHQLLGDLRRYSRLNMQELRKEKVDTDSILDQILGELQPRIREEGATVVREKLPVVMADPTLLRIALQNLVENGIKFHRPGNKPRVVVAAFSRGDAWQFSVQDNGIGIPSRYFQKIFDMFERLNPPDAYPGTGMGLAICRRIVERHGGKIWVESEEGKGSTFCFSLPVDDTGA
ncbi:MAG: ATP-binding protein [Methanomicrobiales archaeon]|nr:ATP-binding protein [Methanomicrobiales archaeon]